MKKFSVILCVFICVASTTAQTTFSFASKNYRDSVTAQLKQQIHQTILLPLNETTSQKWMGAFWAMQLMLYKPKGYEERIPLQITRLPQSGPGFQRAFFEMLYTLYPKEFRIEVTSVWKEFKSEKVKAMALEYIAFSGNTPMIEPGDKFLRSDYYQHYKYVRSKPAMALPIKNDFLHESFLKAETVLCSFQSPNRNNPGYLMIRLPNGEWMKNDKGEELRFTQLARSISNLPFYLTNGNTPQGLYKITGTDTSTNNWIGPTTNLQMILPFENKTSDFFGTDTVYQSFYQNLLGGKLNSYKGLWETYWAGKIGRTEIIAHGTTINPSYYQSQPYYPNTPSLGCLCSPEIWGQNGELVRSLQAEWMQVVLSLTNKPNYLIVAEVQDL